MVQRSPGGRIIFKPEESAEFTLAASVSIDSALDTAEEFHRVGVGIGINAGITLDPSDEYYIPALTLKSERAARLVGFANAIVALCPDEYMARELSKLAEF